MTLRQLQIFDAIVKQQSITSAANEVGISQPTVSKELRLLEKEFGVNLHVRVGHGIEITKAGADFHEKVKLILKLVDDLQNKFKRQVQTKKTTPLLIAATESPSAWLLPKVLKEFRKVHPQINTILRASDPKGVEKLILNSKVDLAITTIASTKLQLVCEPIRSEEVLAVISAASPFAKKLSLRKGALGKIPLVARVKGTITRQLEQQGFRPNIVMHCESVSALKAAVKAGIGVGFLYRDVVQSELADGSFKVIKIPELRQFDIKCFAMYRNNTQLSVEAKEFIDLLRARPRKALPANWWRKEQSTAKKRVRRKA
jgi:LysR family transcriptional regulator, low CO2-responsive transcriptional regulator